MYYGCVSINLIVLKILKEYTMNCHSVFNCVRHNHEMTNNSLIKETVLNYVNDAEFKELFTMTALENIETATSSALAATSSAIKSSLEARNAVNDLTAQTLDFVSDAIYGFKDDIEEVIKSLGFITLDSFELGATINHRNEVLRHTATGKLYRWAGNLPKNVPVDSTPMNSGGVATNAWLEVSDTTLRQDIVAGDIVTTASTKTVPIVGTIGEPRTQQDKDLERISILDFFTQSERAAYEASPTTFDAYRPVQAFFDYINNNKCTAAYADGHFYTSKGITYNSGDSKTTLIRGNFTLEVLGLSAIHTLFHYAPGRERSWVGRIQVIGNGSLTYKNHTCLVGLRIGGWGHMCSHNDITKIEARSFKFVGVLVDTLTSVSNFGQIQASGCGSGMFPTYASLRGTFTSRGDENKAVASVQYTWIDVDTLPPQELTDLGLPCLVAMEKEGFKKEDLHYIIEVDRENSRIKVFPTVDYTYESSPIQYVFGAAVYIRGGDASLTAFNKISTKQSSVGFWNAALYPPIVSNVLSESNHIGVILSANPAGASVGGLIQGLYTENNYYDFINLTRYVEFKNFGILNTTALSQDRLYNLHTWRLSNNTLEKGNFDQISIAYKGEDFKYKATSTGILNMNSSGHIVKILGGSGALTFYFTNVGDTNIRSLYDITGFKLALISRSSNFNHKFISTLTFKPPTGYTINGSTENLVLNGSDYEFPEMYILIDDTTKNIQIVPDNLKTPAKKVYKATVNAPQNSLDTLKSISFNATLSGVTSAYLLEARSSTLVPGLMINCRYNSANTVSLTLFNSTEVPIDLTNINFEIKGVEV